MKRSLARHLKGVRYVICMHDSRTHPYLQMVDYCSWAIYVKWEKQELRPYRTIKALIRSEFDIFRTGSESRVPGSGVTEGV